METEMDMKEELEDGSVELAAKLKGEFTAPGGLEDSTEMLLQVLCSIAISLKKLAEEANHATANMSMGQIK